MIRQLTVGVALVTCTAVAEAGKKPSSKQEAGLRNSGEWTASKYLEEIDHDDPSLPEILKGRHRSSSPLVIRGAYTGHRLVKYWGNLAKVAKSEEKAGGKIFIFNQVKVSKTPVFGSIWKDTIRWIGNISDAQRPNQEHWHKWHHWHSKEVKRERFIKHFSKPGAPYHYWLHRLPDAVLGKDGDRATICDKFVPTGSEGRCPTEDSWWAVYGSSQGVVTQAHFDIGAAVFIHAKGRKKWTFWQPKDLPSMCLTPYAHPSFGQSQIDMEDLPEDRADGSSIAACRWAPQHNRTVTLAPGDVLLVQVSTESISLLVLLTCHK